MFFRHTLNIDTFIQTTGRSPIHRKAALNSLQQHVYMHHYPEKNIITTTNNSTNNVLLQTHNPCYGHFTSIFSSTRLIVHHTYTR